MDNTPQAKVPVFIWVVIVAILAAMYGYAAYWDPTRPEQTVKNFYHAFSQRDYNTVASNLSVIIARQFLPQYAAMNYTELLANRAEIEKELSHVFSGLDAASNVPKDLSVEIMKPYTKEGTNTAIVVCRLKNKSEELGTNVVILGKEQGRFRIFSMGQIDEQSLPQIMAEDINNYDADYEKLLTSSK